MARWKDIAPRQESTVNQGGSMIEVRGLVVHIAEGSYEGTISWQQNPAAEVSSHFIVSKKGAICQMVDTSVTAWTQSSGNGRWISVENEGFSGTPLTDAQLQANAVIFDRVCRTYNVPYQVTSSTNGFGLGHHAMGGASWGGHYDCPGDPIIKQKPQIVSLAKSGGSMAMTTADAKVFWDYVIESAGIGPHAAYDLQKQAYDIKQNVLPPMDVKLDSILTTVGAEAPVTITDAQLDTLADKVAAKLQGLTYIATNTTPQP